MLSFQSTVEISPSLRGVPVRALTDSEVDVVLNEAGKCTGRILNERTVVLPDSLASNVRADQLANAAIDFLVGLLALVPLIVSYGCDEPDTDRVKALPAGVSILLACEIADLTRQKFGFDKIKLAFALSCARHSELASFLAPIVRERLKRITSQQIKPKRLVGKRRKSKRRF